jgi:hypothetical protein
MAKAAQLAPAVRLSTNERRRPEDTVLYQLVQEHLETFLAQVEGETGAGLPKFVKAEFDAFLQRGIFAPWVGCHRLSTFFQISHPR